MLGESQLSEVTSNLSFHTSMPVSPLLKNEKYLETSSYMLQSYEIKPFVPLSNFEGSWGILDEFGFSRS